MQKNAAKRFSLGTPLNARNWFFRSPNPSNANNVRNANTSGGLNNNNANNAYGAVPDREKARNQVGR